MNINNNASTSMILQSHLSAVKYQNELEQLESLRSEDTPYRLMITHTIES